MKTKPCPYCAEKMYIYARMGKWICSDHARCGYTLAATETEIDIFKNYMTRRSVELQKYCVK